MNRTIAACCLVTLLAACTDPQARNPEDATNAIRSWGQKLAAANGAETLDERIEQCRTAAQRLASIPGASSEQQNAAALVAARGYLQAATFGMQKIDEMMAQDRAARALIAGLLPDMVVAGAALEAIGATDLGPIAAELERLATTFEAGGVLEGIDAVALAEKADELKTAAATLQATSETQLAEARERLQASRTESPMNRVIANDEALGVTLLAREAARDGMVADVTYEALAATAMELAAMADADDNLGAALERAAASVAVEAKRLQDVAQANAEALEVMSAQVAEAVKGIEDRQGDALKQAVDAVTQDLDQAATNAGRAAMMQGASAQSGRNEQLTIALLQARLADLRASAALADAAIADMAGKAGDVADEIEFQGIDPSELVSAAVTSYKSAKESIDGSSATEESKTAMKAQLDTAIKSLESPEDFAAEMAAKSGISISSEARKSVKRPARARPTVPAPAPLPDPVGFESAEALLETMKTSYDSVEDFDRIAKCMSGRNDASRRDGQVLGTLSSAMAPIVVAMKASFGPEALAALGESTAGAADAGNASLTDVTDTEATLVTGATNITLFKDGEAWFIDVASLPQEAMSNPMMKQLGAQIGMIAGPMRDAAEAVAAKITAGEIADPGAAMQAFQQAMMGAMMKAASGAMGGLAMPQDDGDEATEGGDATPEGGDGNAMP
ncbi:MAG: hypothetical protein FJ254_05580 [Phycisphaerae bacterium]|nr:hypothetical protein [Phycisphaerae bacterium]